MGQYGRDCCDAQVNETRHRRCHHSTRSLPTYLSTYVSIYLASRGWRGLPSDIFLLASRTLQEMASHEFAVLRLRCRKLPTSSSVSFTVQSKTMRWGALRVNQGRISLEFLSIPDTTTAWWAHGDLPILGLGQSHGRLHPRPGRHPEEDPSRERRFPGNHAHIIIIIIIFNCRVLRISYGETCHNRSHLAVHT